MTLLMSVIQLYWSYSIDVDGLSSRIEQIEKSYSTSIKKNIWDFNRDSLTINADGIYRLPDIVFVKIYSDKQTYVSLGKPLEKNHIEKTIKISQEKDGKSIELGYLQVVASKERINQKLLSEILVVFSSNFVKALIVSFAIYFLVQLLIIRHLITLKRTYLSEDSELNKKNVQFNRKGELFMGKEDIFDLLKASIVRKNRILAQKYQEIEEIRDELAAANQNLEAKINASLAKLKEGQDQLIHASKLALLGEFSAGICHELNNPLVIIKGYSELLLRKEFPRTEQDKMVQDILKSAERMENISNHLKKFSRVDKESDWTIFKLSEVISESLTFLKIMLKVGNVELVTNYEDSKVVYGNMTKLVSIIQNFVSNSVDAFASAPAKDEKLITITTEDDKENSDNVKITYKDNAGGIKPEILNSIFDAFFTTKGPEKGTGLGMSIVQTIVEEHKGRIRVENEYGVGITFAISFPSTPIKATSNIDKKTPTTSNTANIAAAKEIPKHYPEIINIGHKPSEQNPSHKKLKILIIDDEPDICGVLSSYLSETFDVDACIDPTEGLEKLGTLSYDLIMTDIKMPKVTGYDIILATEKLGREIPIVVISGHVKAEEVFQKIQRNSPIGYLAKPFEEKSVLLEINQRLIGTTKNS